MPDPPAQPAARSSRTSAALSSISAKLSFSSRPPRARSGKSSRPDPSAKLLRDSSRDLLKSDFPAPPLTPRRSSLLLGQSVSTGGEVGSNGLSRSMRRLLGPAPAVASQVVSASQGYEANCEGSGSAAAW